MRVVVSVAAVMLVIACTTPTDMCGCPPTLPWMVAASGRIVSLTGQRVADATITAIGARGACPSSAAELALRVGGPPVDSTGAYRLGFFGTGADTLCIRVIARRTVAGRMDSVRSVPFTVRLRQVPPFDSLRVDFQLP